nr:SLC13 family permease [Microvirga massiliensis]
MMTLIGTAPNLVAHGELVRRGYQGFSFFSFTPLGIPLLVLAIGYVLMARPWLARASVAPAAAGRQP